MRIDSVAGSPDRAGRYLVKFDSGTTMRLYRQTVEDFGLCPGLELDEARMQQLRDHASATSAKMRALRIVTASNVSKKDLEQRLIRKGEDPQQAKEAVRWMSDYDLIDDRKTAAQIVARCVSKGYGVARAKQALYEKQIPKELWEEALEDYPDQSDYILKFLRSKLTDPDDPKQTKKAVDALLRRGHSYSRIRQGLEELGQEIEEFSEDF